MHKTDDALVERIALAIERCRKIAHSDHVEKLAKEGLWPESNWWPSYDTLARAILAELPQYTGAAEVTEADEIAARNYCAATGHTGGQTLNLAFARHRAAGFAAGAADMQRRAAQAALEFVPLPGNPRQVLGTYAQGCFDTAAAIAALPKEPQP